MNKNDLILLGNYNIIIIDIQKKEIINNIDHKVIGCLTFMYKLTEKMILLGGWGNYIEQIEYDEIEKNIKVISNNNKNDYFSSNKNFEMFDISSISVFNNKLIVSPYKNKLDNSSLIIYQIKNK